MSELYQRLERAHHELCEAVRRQWGDQPAFKLSIPARPDTDTDLIIGAALRDAMKAISGRPGSAPARKTEARMDRHLLQRASRMFNSVADLRTEEDRRINDWFKEQLAASVKCARCGASADSEIHYVGTVDSHTFEPEAK